MDVTGMVSQTEGQQPLSLNRSTTEAALTTFDQTLSGSPTVTLWRLTKRTFDHSPPLSPREANLRYGIEGSLSFDQPINESEAQRMNLQDRQDRHTQLILQQAPHTKVANSVYHLSQCVAFFLDPFAFIPLIFIVLFLRRSVRYQKTLLAKI